MLQVDSNRLMAHNDDTLLFKLEYFIFLKLSSIQNATLEVTVVDYDPIGNRSEPIGKVVLGCSAIGSELSHWHEMLASPGLTIAKWHSLKDPEDGKPS